MFLNRDKKSNADLGLLYVLNRVKKSNVDLGLLYVFK
jgi:hypothetical protein